jgi:flagellin-like protein
MIVEKKKGLSPVMATILLVAIALILAVIIFLWARNFIGETITKNERNIEQSCDEVNFVAEAYGGNLYLENTGSVPIYAVEMKVKRVLGDIEDLEEFQGTGVKSGETGSVSLPSQVSSGDSVIVIPVLLGETTTKKKPHPCDEVYGEEIIVE